MMLNLGCGGEKLEGYIGVDMVAGVNVDVVAEIEKLPFETSSADVVRVWNVLEHVKDLNACLKEIHRVLKPDGILIISVPHWSGWLSHYEEHVRDFNLYSFMDYTSKKRMTSRHGIEFEILDRKIAWDSHGAFRYRKLISWLVNTNDESQAIYEQTFLAYLFPAIELHFTLKAKK